MLGQKAGQAQNVASRCLWDSRTDGAVSEEYENESLYCLCQVCKDSQLRWHLQTCPVGFFITADADFHLLQVYCLYFQ